jgi:hypothetical protein
MKHFLQEYLAAIDTGSMLPSHVIHTPGARLQFQIHTEASRRNRGLRRGRVTNRPMTLMARCGRP